MVDAGQVKSRGVRAEGEKIVRVMVSTGLMGL
jgi:hypothetical protein